MLPEIQLSFREVELKRSVHSANKKLASGAARVCNARISGFRFTLSLARVKFTVPTTREFIKIFKMVVF